MNEQEQEKPAVPVPAPGEQERAEVHPADEELARRIDELSRALAELINDRESFKRRLEREHDRQLQAERGDVARQLFEAMDELERALAAGEGNAEALAHGVRMIALDLQRRIEGLGLTRIAASGERFDPVLHEALDLVPVSDPRQDGMVVEEVRAGWRAGDRVVRPARVRVGRFQAAGPRS